VTGGAKLMAAVKGSGGGGLRIKSTSRASGEGAAPQGEQTSHKMSGTATSGEDSSFKCAEVQRRPAARDKTGPPASPASAQRRAISATGMAAMCKA
jgi:hypothetical protein